MSDSAEMHWYVARSRNDHEMKIRSRLMEIGVENFIPTQVVVRTKNGKKVKVEVPVVRNLIFIHATKEVALSLPNGYGLNLWYMIDPVKHTLLEIPTKQMDDFKLVWDLDPEALCISEEPIVVGGRVRVMKGNFAGVEGNVVSMPNKTYVVVSIGASPSRLSATSPHQIDALLVAKVKIPKSYLIPV
ncbi:MAG: UpxY family transcription antiterminator [Bacteroidales bacterium]|nr:UpxY family transcription antiterminator [Bacteroidales bacterium]